MSSIPNYDDNGFEDDFEDTFDELINLKIKYLNQNCLQIL